MHVLGFHVPGTRTWEQEKEAHAERRFEETYTAARELERVISHGKRDKIETELERLEQEVEEEGRTITEALAVVTSLGSQAQPTHYHGDRQKEHILWLKEHLVQKGFLERYGKEFSQLCKGTYDEQKEMVAIIRQGLGKYPNSEDVRELVLTLLDTLRRVSKHLYKLFYAIEKEPFTEEEFEQRIMRPMRSIRQSAVAAHQRAAQRVA